MPRTDSNPERTTNYTVIVGNSTDLSKNTPCPGTFSRDADIVCGLNGRYVGIMA